MESLIIYLRIYLEEQAQLAEKLWFMLAAAERN